MNARRFRAVWEITLQCNLACLHCGSRAAHARPDELTTAEALDLVRQLAEAGIEEVALIGGEAYLRRDWLTIAAAIAKSGIRRRFVYVIISLNSKNWISSDHFHSYFSKRKAPSPALVVYRSRS